MVPKKIDAFFGLAIHHRKILTLATLLLSIIVFAFEQTCLFYKLVDIPNSLLEIKKKMLLGTLCCWQTHTAQEEHKYGWKLLPITLSHIRVPKGVVGNGGEGEEGGGGHPAHFLLSPPPPPPLPSWVDSLSGLLSPPPSTCQREHCWVTKHPKKIGGRRRRWRRKGASKRHERESRRVKVLGKKRGGEEDSWFVRNAAIGQWFFLLYSPSIPFRASSQYVPFLDLHHNKRARAGGIVHPKKGGGGRGRREGDDCNNPWLERGSHMHQKKNPRQKENGDSPIKKSGLEHIKKKRSAVKLLF